ncbi:MAG: hypothetical protein PUF39_00340 [Prevotellaceae bacterium]|nr:hypothetical protein [Prevotellaceae bacterium]
MEKQKERQYGSVLLRVLLVMLVVCHTGILEAAVFPSIPKEKVLTSDMPSLNDQRRYDYFFLEAVRMQNMERYDAAFDLLQHCVSINPAAAEAYFYQSMLYAMMQNDTLTLKLLDKAVSLRPDNYIYLEQAAKAYYNYGMKEKTIAAFERLAATHKERTDVLQVLIDLYQEQKAYDQMLRCIQQLEQIDGSTVETALMKVKAYELKEDMKMAYKVLQNLVDEHPYDLHCRVMMGNWLLVNGRQKEAFKVLTEALKEEPNNVYVQSSLYDYYVAEGMREKADDLLEKMLVNPQTESQSKVSLMRQVIQENERQGGDSTAVLQLFNRIAKISPKDATMAELKVAYMELKQMPDSCMEQALRQTLQIVPDNAGLRMELLQRLLKKQQWDSLIAVSKSGTEYNPEEMGFYYFLGISHYQKDEPDEALDAFRRGIGVINEKSNAVIVSDFYSIMGDILIKKGLKQEAYAALDSCLKWKSDNIECLNNYAYYLSEENRQLDKAAEMSYRTIKADPKNPTYLDTYAWVLFRQERYAEAKLYIDQALANDTSEVKSGVVLEHAGDIYAKNLDLDKAVSFWKQAEEAGGGSALLPKKIQMRKWIEE